MITLKMIKERLNREQVYTSQKYWDDLVSDGYGPDGKLPYTNPYINDIYHDVEADIVNGMLGDIRGKDVLDLGCGPGRYCRDFAARGARVHGIDFSPKSIEMARELSTDAAITYAVGSIYDLADEQAYDVVVCSRVLAVACKSADDVRHCLKRVHEALRPGGRAIFIEPMHASFMRRVLKMNLAEFKQALAETGFTVTSVQQAEFYPGRIGLAYLRLPRGLTKALFTIGEVVGRIAPASTDQKFVAVVR